MPHCKSSRTPRHRQYQDLKSVIPTRSCSSVWATSTRCSAEDARTAAPVLGLVLTSRHDVPMCGVPFHNSQTYIARLLKAGHKVAVVEQMEDPSKTKKLSAEKSFAWSHPAPSSKTSSLSPPPPISSSPSSSTSWGWARPSRHFHRRVLGRSALNDRGSRKLLDLLARVRPAEVLAAPHAAESLRLREVLPSRTCLTPYDGAPEMDQKPAWAQSPIWINHHLAQERL